MTGELSVGVRLFRGFFVVLGMIAVGTGVFAMLTGAAGMPNEGEASGSVESELRFFAAFWVAYGVVALNIATRAETEFTVVRALALAMFVGGIGRFIALVTVESPHSLFFLLMCVELILPIAIVAWQHKLARRSEAQPWPI